VALRLGQRDPDSEHDEPHSDNGHEADVVRRSRRPAVPPSVEPRQHLRDRPGGPGRSLSESFALPDQEDAPPHHEDAGDDTERRHDYPF